MIIAVDFDGTIVDHMYPAIGKAVPLAIESLKKLQKNGHQLILWTVRIGIPLKEAVNYCIAEGVVFWGINENPEQKYWNGSPKAYAQVYIDDAAFGCPLIWQKEGRPFVDWLEVMRVVEKFEVHDLK